MELGERENKVGVTSPWGLREKLVEKLGQGEGKPLKSGNVVGER